MRLGRLSNLYQGGRELDLRRMRKGVRGVSCLDLETAPAFLCVLGGRAAQTRDAARQHGFSSSVPNEGPVQPSITPSEKVRTFDVPPQMPQTPGEKTESTEDRVVSDRTLAVRLRNVRALWRKDRQRLEPARCCDCDLRFLFPQNSQHLPFPFRNARVEVGRTVMEG